MNTQIMEEANTRSLQGTITFGEVVKNLLAEGVESYHADLVRREKTYYMPDGQTHLEKLNYQGPATARDFSQEAVIAALRTIQKGEINYVEFLNRILKAGCTQYTVFLQGKKAIYFGRKGEFYVENFPNR